MNTTATAALAIAISQRRQEVLEAHRRAGALCPRRAIAYRPPSRIHGRTVRRLLRQGVLRDEAGRTWLDDHGLAEASHRERCVALRVLIGLMAVVGVLLLSMLGR